MIVLRLLLQLLLGLLSAQLSQATSQRPNILLLMAEDMSPRLGAFGDRVAVTPQLDALAREGVRYTNVFTTAGVCAPSRAAHILGMHQISTGTQHTRSSTRPEGAYYSVPPEQVKAYPELLRAAGYYTYTDQKLDYQFSGPTANTGPNTVWDSEGDSNPDWRGRAEGQPFFGFRNFLVTHESGVFRPLGSMPESAMHLRMQLARWWLMDGSPVEQVRPDEVIVPPYYPDTATVRRDLARHYDNIAYMDAEVGGILERLEQDGLADSTIVTWTTDHGDGLPRAKRDLFDSGIKVPMIIRWPAAFRPEGLSPGSLDTRLVSFVDLAPTVLTLAGVDVPAYMQGRDFASPDGVPRDYIYASRDRIDKIMDRQRAVRDRRFKYIRSWYPDQPEGTGLAYRDNVDMVREMRRLYVAGKLDDVQRLWFEPPGEERLFDLERDPHEIQNLSDNPDYAGELQRMRNVLAEWQARVGDWSEESENKMVSRFQPGGKRRQTRPPKVYMKDARILIEPVTPGSSLEYRLDGGGWHLYTAPFDAGSAKEIEARAVRYGWQESDIVIVP
jgi:N-sulfoglucosamine sulfohydrolase